MELSEIYAVAAGSLICLFIVWQLASLEILVSRTTYCLCFARQLSQKLLFQRRRGSSNYTVAGALGIALFVAVNATASSLWVHSTVEARDRLNALFLVNLIPLFLGGTVSTLTSGVLGWTISHQSLSHRWIGRVCILEGLVAGFLTLKQSNWLLDDWTTVVVALLFVCGAASLLPLRRLHELHSKLHLLLVLGLVTCLWLQHGRIGRDLRSICLIVGTSLWVFNKTMSLVHIVWMNKSSGSPGRVAILPPDGLRTAATHLLLDIRLPRPRVIKSGQFVFLTVPTVPPVSGMFQSHPYLIAWSDSSETSESVKLFVQCRAGFSAALRSHLGTSSVIVDGPYGGTPQIEHFDKVLFMASGIGISAHLLAIRQLLQAHVARSSRVRRVTLVWYLESRDEELLAAEYIEELMKLDSRNIFTMLIYSREETVGTKIEGIWTNREAMKAVEKGTDVTTNGVKTKRMMLTYRPLDLDWYLNKEWEAEAGNMALSLCGSPSFEMAVRRALLNSNHDIRLICSPFQMDEVGLQTTTRAQPSTGQESAV